MARPGRSRSFSEEWLATTADGGPRDSAVPGVPPTSGAPGQYQGAPDDGSRPAIFLINPSEPTTQPRADAENTARHEAIPGHHLQVAIAKERTGLHWLSRYTFNRGFGEGWGLYAERLGDEMGLDSGDLGWMGMLGSEAFRAARMVIDAGIRAFHDQVLEYGSRTPESPSHPDRALDRRRGDSVRP